MATTKRMKYDASFKCKVIKFAKNTNNCAAAREFGINEKLVRDWKKNELLISKMPKSKCALRTGKVQWPELENAVEDWVTANRQNGYIISRNSIRLFALKWSKSNYEENTDFKATIGWCDRFMKRKNLVLRQRTKIAQKLPEDYNDKLINFQRFVINLRKKYEYPLSQIGNMDETPVYFDMPSNKTVDVKGRKTIFTRSTGHEKTRFTVVLTCLANGEKLKPMVIFKRKTLPKIKFPDGIFVHVHENGWMDEEGVRLWLNNIWDKRPDNQERSLLVWDMFRSHLTENVKMRARRKNVDMAVIPGGMTSLVQPLDVSLNKPFKDSLREKWINWMMDGEKTYTKGGNVRQASLDTVCSWVLEAWNSINSDIVQKSFKKCGISNSLDGTEDDMLWDDDMNEENNVNENVWDPYDTQEFTHNDIDELFNSDSDSD